MTEATLITPRLVWDVIEDIGTGLPEIGSDIDRAVRERDTVSVRRALGALLIDALQAIALLDRIAADEDGKPT
jgi:hypothetical protein